MVIGLLQRVSRAEVRAGGKVVGAIGHGLVVLVGVERNDGEAQAERLLERLLGYRVFADSAGRMNRCLPEVGGSLLLVPQFTLAADTRKGARPGFSPAAPPDEAQRLFEHLLRCAGERYTRTQAGCFGADMQLELVNEGPVTFRLRVSPPSGPRAPRARA